MAFTYCPHCGFKNLYSIHQPKFCGSCGESIGSKTNKTLKKSFALSSQKSKAKNISIDDPDGSDVYEVPNISKLSYSITHDSNKIDLKDLIPLEELDEYDEKELNQQEK